MKHEMYTLFDDKAKVFNKPFMTINRATCMRAVRDLLKDMTTDPARHPEDFVLMYIGTFDDSSCEYELEPGCEVVGRLNMWSNEEAEKALDAMSAVLKEVQ